ncbi:MAG: tRNA (adenosine(37)-N6)-threonylcarbamoyltransferase complex dimerization subunit type 1 TsaB, partial [Thermoguttaceae bacterium]
MKILAFETIEMSASAALLDDENVLASTTLPPQQRSAQYLAPAVRDLLAQTGWKPTDVQLIVVSQGPGSFTGLRVGITFAKIFAWAVGADVIALNTL